MTFHISHRWGGSEIDPPQAAVVALLDELAETDIEHPNVALTHESEWSLGVFPSGRVVWENLEEGEPRHLFEDDRDEILRLLFALAEGRLDDVEAAPWLPGYGPPTRASG